MLGFERRWACSVLEAFAPPGEIGLSPRKGEIDYVGGFQRMVRFSTPQAALGVRLALWIAALAPLWLWRKPARICRLDIHARCALLQQLSLHRSFVVRELTMLLKMAASLSLLGNQRMRSRSNYDRGVTPPWGEWDPEIVRSGTRRRLSVIDPSDVSEAG